MSVAPVISVIVPNYNHAAFLKQRLDTVFNQTYSSFEVIILDDCSIDDSMKVIDTYRNKQELVEVIRNETNGGTSIQQWKKGIQIAKGEWIWIAESDDYCELDFLEKMLSYAKVFPSCGILYCQSENVNEYGNSVSNRLEYTKEFDSNIWINDFTMEGNKFISQYLKTKNVIPNASAVLFKRDLVNLKNDFDIDILNMFYAADWLFWIRIIEKTNIGFKSATLNYFRQHKDTTRVHDTKKKVFKRLKEEVIIRNFLLSKYPELNQNNEWEEIYGKWFNVQNSFPYFNSLFYFFRKSDLSTIRYIQKFRMFLSKKNNRVS